MRILLLLRSLGMGGAERQAVLLASALADMGHQASIVTFYPGGKLADEAHTKGVAVHCVHKAGRWDIFRFAYRLYRTARAMRPDVVYGFNELPNLLAVSLRPAIPGCRIAWGIRNDLARSGRSFPGAIMGAIIPYLSPLADIVIANSQTGMANATKGRDGTVNAFVVHNGVDLAYFSPSDEQRTRLRRELGIAAGEKLLGSIGHLRKSKGSEDLVLAFSQLAESHPDWKLMLVGDDGVMDERSREILQAAGLIPRTIVLPERSDINAVFNAIDLLCSASRSEGFPNVIVEAMACGRPCVVSDAGESALVVGEHGQVFPSGDVAALREALDAAMTDTGRFGEPDAIRQSVVTRFSPEVLAERTVSILAGN